MSPISGKEEMYYSPRKTMKKVLMVSAPLTLLCLRWDEFNFEKSRIIIRPFKVYNTAKKMFQKITVDSQQSSN